jgi:hypothetical protein
LGLTFFRHLYLGGNYVGAISFFVYHFDVYNEDFAYFSYVLSSCDTHQVLKPVKGGGEVHCSLEL